MQPEQPGGHHVASTVTRALLTKVNGESPETTVRKAHCRGSFGTMDEMKKAVAVFAEVLGKKVATAA